MRKLLFNIFLFIQILFFTCLLSYIILSSNIFYPIIIRHPREYATISTSLGDFTYVIYFLSTSLITAYMLTLFVTQNGRLAQKSKLLSLLKTCLILIPTYYIIAGINSFYNSSTFATILLALAHPFIINTCLVFAFICSLPFIWNNFLIKKDKTSLIIKTYLILILILNILVIVCCLNEQIFSGILLAITDFFLLCAMMITMIFPQNTFLTITKKSSLLVKVCLILIPVFYIGATAYGNYHSNESGRFERPNPSKKVLIALNEYRSKNGEYPSKISILPISTLKLVPYKYTTFNKNKDFKLHIYNVAFSPGSGYADIIYCSKQYSGCSNDGLTPNKHPLWSDYIFNYRIEDLACENGAPLRGSLDEYTYMKDKIPNFSFSTQAKDKEGNIYGIAYYSDENDMTWAEVSIIKLSPDGRFQWEEKQTMTQDLTAPKKHLLFKNNNLYIYQEGQENVPEINSHKECPNGSKILSPINYKKEKMVNKNDS